MMRRFRPEIFDLGVADLTAQLGPAAALACVAMIDDHVLNRDRLDQLVAWCAKNVPRDDVIITLTEMGAGRGNRPDGALVHCEWHWVPGERSRAAWRQLYDQRAEGEGEQGWIEPLCEALGLASDALISRVGDWLVTHGRASAGDVALMASGRYVGPTRLALLSALTWSGAEHADGAQAAKKPRQLIERDRTLVDAIRRALHAKDGLEALAALRSRVVHDGARAIIEYLVDCAQRGSRHPRVSTVERYLDYVAILTAPRFSAITSMTGEAISAALQDAVAAVPQETTDHHRRRHLQQALEMMHDSVWLEGAPKVEGHVRATLLSEAQWCWLLRRWCADNADLGSMAAGLMLLLLLGRLGLRSEEAEQLRLCDIDDRAVRVRPTVRSAGSQLQSGHKLKTKNAVRRIPLMPYLTEGEFEFVRSFVSYLRAVHGDQATSPVLALMLMGGGGLGHFDEWLKLRMRDLTGEPGAGRHRLRHVAITRAHALLLEPEAYAAHLCSLSVEEVRLRRCQALQGQSPQACWRRFCGHAEGGEVGFDYVHDAEIKALWRRLPCRPLPQPGEEPPWPPLPIGPEALLPLLRLHRDQPTLEWPQGVKKHVQSWARASLRVGMRRRLRSAKLLFRLDDHPALPLPVSLTGMAEVALSNSLSMLKRSACDASTALAAVQWGLAHMGDRHRPGVLYADPLALAAHMPFWSAIDCTRVVAVSNERGQPGHAWVDACPACASLKQLSMDECYSVRLQPSTDCPGSTFGLLNTQLFVAAVWFETEEQQREQSRSSAG